MKPNRYSSVNWAKEMEIMLIFTLAAAMMIAMLIATAFGLHEESQRVKLENRVRPNRNRFYR